jgi:DNA polymerase-3 subunit epsilon
MAEFAVLDLETTGLYPSTDRIVEVGVVRLNDAGVVLDEFCTVVNPLRDVGPTHIHGLHAAELVNAPTFKEVADDVLSVLAGAVLVAHHARFDVGFLNAEMRRVGRSCTFDRVLCTLELLYAIEPRAPRRLTDCCAYFGIPVEEAHTALGDARMAAALVSKLFAAWPYPALPEPFEIEGFAPSGRAMGRAQTVDPRVTESTYLSALLQRLPPLGPELVSAAAAGEYLNLLDRVLEDRRIDSVEAEALTTFAREVGLSAGETRGLHASYLAALCAAATADGVVTKNEFHDLEVVATLLAVRDWEGLLQTRPAPRPDPHRAEFLTAGLHGQSRPADSSESVSSIPAGTTVCFTGEMRWQRDECERMAAERGLVVKSGVSGRLQILVVADPFTQSGKAKKARELGTRVIAEAAFWELLGVR